MRLEGEENEERILCIECNGVSRLGYVYCEDCWYRDELRLIESSIRDCKTAMSFNNIPADEWDVLIEDLSYYENRRQKHLKKRPSK
jgi:hypothetical protein